jgi:hypothetical protein
LLAGRFEERLASIGWLDDITPVPGAAGVMLIFSSSIFFLDLIGRVAQGTPLEASFENFVRTHGDQEPFARLWRSAAPRCAMFAHAHDDPWAALQHRATMQSIHDEIAAISALASWASPTTGCAGWRTPRATCWRSTDSNSRHVPT